MQVLIDDFPNDNIIRYVADVGAVKDPLSPKVSVLLQPLASGYQPSTHHISVPELDIVRRSSIWIGQAQTKEYFKHKGKVVDETFDIKLLPDQIKVVPLREILKNTDRKTLCLPYNKRKEDGKWTYVDIWFKEATYNIIPHGSIEVIISSMEMLTATYAPTRKDLRRKILTDEPSELLNSYLRLEKCSYDKLNNECILYPKVSVGDSSLIFLAHLYCNTYVQQVYENNRRSLERRFPAKSGGFYPHRYPEVRPYHQDELKISASGIWLDAQKKRFFVLRINECCAPNNLKVRVVESSKQYVKGELDSGLPEKEPGSTNYRTLTNPKNLNVKTKQNPEKGKRGIYMISEIQSKVENGAIVRQTDVEIIPSNDRHDGGLKETVTVFLPGEEEIYTSSGEPFKNKKGIIRQFKTLETKFEQLSQLSVINDVIEGLKTLVADEESELTELNFLDINGCRQGYGYRISLKSYESVNEAWILKNNDIRRVALLELSLKDEKNFCYILEVERLDHDESFLGLTIKSAQRMSSSQVDSILQHIVEEKGVKTTIYNLNKKGENNEYFNLNIFKHNLGKLKWPAKLEIVIAQKLKYKQDLEVMEQTTPE